MFDLLKKKIGKFTEKVKNRLEAGPQAAVSGESPKIGEEAPGKKPDDEEALDNLVWGIRGEHPSE